MKRTLTAAAVIAGGIALAPTAHAGPYEYVAALDENGVYYANILDVIDVGKRVCRALRSGMAVEAVLDGVRESGYSSMETALIAYSAADNMCPDTLPTLDGFTKGQKA